MNSNIPLFVLFMRMTFIFVHQGTPISAGLGEKRGGKIAGLENYFASAPLIEGRNFLNLPTGGDSCCLSHKDKLFAILV